MPQNNTMYRNLSIFFAVTTIIFSALYFTKPSQTITETFSGISADSEECKDRVVAWQAANASNKTISVEAQAELNTILAECGKGLENSKAKI